MLRNESILCFAPDPWDDIWRNRHQIMSLLSRQNRVLYVEPRPYLRPVMRRAAAHEIGLREMWGPRLSEVNPGLHVFHPPLYAPLSGRAPLRQVLDAIRDASLRRAMRRVGVARPILWLFRPDQADVPGRYGESLTIYHVVDEYAGYADVDAEQAASIRQRERNLITQADLVLVTSQALLEDRGGLNPHTYWVPNAVNYDAFAQARDRREEPAELAGMPHPRLGYVGAINDKIDTGLLLHLAQSLPEAILILVGPVRPTSNEMRAGVKALRAQSNVRLIGQVSVEQVPGFVAACDLGLLPYRRNAWTRHIHPLKLYEYLACGLPVVATDIPSVHEEGDLIDIADDAESFVALVSMALARDSEAVRIERQRRASHNTWMHRVERISELIDIVRAAQGRASAAGGGIEE
ncbi:MAG: glycosyltransferase [Anaerolineae bacterium]|nr:glycosyltransferase [Anaerolineae bacterium]